MASFTICQAARNPKETIIRTVSDTSQKPKTKPKTRGKKKSPSQAYASLKNPRKETHKNSLLNQKPALMLVQLGFKFFFKKHLCILCNREMGMHHRENQTKNHDH
jgi:hypothetical protein